MTNAQITSIQENPFVQINGGSPYYKLFLRDVLFITAPATTKIFENILILLFKWEFRFYQMPGRTLKTTTDINLIFVFATLVFA
jgi:hypothetical protein